MKIVRRRSKLIFSSNLTHLGISHYHPLSDKKFNDIADTFPNIVHLDLNFSTGFNDKTLNRIAEIYSNLKYRILPILSTTFLREKSDQNYGWCLKSESFMYYFICGFFFKKKNFTFEKTHLKGKRK